MKIGFYCESPADRAALAVFTEGILGEPPEPINMDLAVRTVPAFFSVLDGAFRGLHYNSDAEGLVVVVDSDKTGLHEAAHDKLADGAGNCRFCQIHRIITQARKPLKERTGRLPLKVAIGLAVPEIEAWYLVGRYREVGEAAWLVGQSGGRPPFTKKQLKQEIYETNRPSLELATLCAVREARRIIGNLKAIEDSFPVGFGLMAQEIRSWVPAK